MSFLFIQRSGLCQINKVSPYCIHIHSVWEEKEEVNDVLMCFRTPTALDFISQKEETFLSRTSFRKTTKRFILGGNNKTSDSFKLIYPDLMWAVLSETAANENSSTGPPCASDCWKRLKELLTSIHHTIKTADKRNCALGSLFLVLDISCHTVGSVLMNMIADQKHMLKCVWKFWEVFQIWDVRCALKAESELHAVNIWTLLSFVCTVTIIQRFRQGFPLFLSAVNIPQWTRLNDWRMYFWF